MIFSSIIFSREFTIYFVSFLYRYVDKNTTTPDDTKSKHSRRSNNTIEGTVDSIPTRDESSSSDVEGKKNSPKSKTTPATQPTLSKPPPSDGHGSSHSSRNLYSQRSREGGGVTRPRSAGPSYSRPTISNTYQRPWQSKFHMYILLYIASLI